MLYKVGVGGWGGASVCGWRVIVRVSECVEGDDCECEGGGGVIFVWVCGWVIVYVGGWMVDWVWVWE